MLYNANEHITNSKTFTKFCFPYDILELSYYNLT